MEVELNRPQNRFLQLDRKFRGFIGGFGASKTYTGCISIVKNFYESPRINQGYFSPTFGHIRDIFYPTIEEVGDKMGMMVDIRYGNKEVHFYSGGKYYGTTICRSMDKPGSIVGFKIGHALLDELDILPVEKAREAWRKIIARLRWKDARNSADVTTTPEGFKFVYQQFVKAVRENPSLGKLYGFIQASTYENEANLPPGYIESLKESYPPSLIEAYLNGKFINLTSGTVYHHFDPNLNHTDERIEEGEPLYIGMDFNVGRMSAVTHVKRSGLPIAADEITGGYDTPDMIHRIKSAYWRYDGNDYRKRCEIIVYPDSSGDSRKSVNASVTDIAQIKAAGFRVRAKKANPPVKDRVNSVNAMFCNAKGQRRYRVNTHKCPVYTEALQQQAWKNGEPDKESGFDDIIDSAGYFIYHDYPLTKPSFKQIKLSGH